MKKKKINWEGRKNQRMSSNNDYLSAVKKIRWRAVHTGFSNEKIKKRNEWKKSTKKHATPLKSNSVKEKE